MQIGPETVSKLRFRWFIKNLVVEGNEDFANRCARCARFHRICSALISLLNITRETHGNEIIGAQYVWIEMDFLALELFKPSTKIAVFNPQSLCFLQDFWIDRLVSANPSRSGSKVCGLRNGHHHLGAHI